MAIRKHSRQSHYKPAKYGSPLHHKRISESLRERHRGGGKSGRKNWYWIQKMNLKKGALHKALHVPLGERIPKGKLEKATRSRNPHVKHMAVVARTLEGLHHKKRTYRRRLASVKRRMRARR